jgi:hypothetical protein
MEQPEQYQLTQMVNYTMVFIARCFLIPAVLQFVVITRYYASLRLAGNKNQRTLNPIQLRTEVFRLKNLTRNLPGNVRILIKSKWLSAKVSIYFTQTLVWKYYSAITN